MSSRGALVVIGSGPGVGRTTAATFAEHGFSKIILLSRNESRLAEDASYITSKHPNAQVEIHQFDAAADEATVKKVLAGVDAKLKSAGVPLEVVLYNAARVAPSILPDHEAEELTTDLRITTVSLYLALQWALPHLLATAAASGSYNPAFLTTSGGLYSDPKHFLFSLSAAKASQHNLMHSFHQKYEPDIHFACIAIAGVVSDDAKVTSAKAVADLFWELYGQPKGTVGRNTVRMEDPDYERQVTEMGRALGQI